MKKLYSIEIKGNHGLWSFNVLGTKEDYQDWLDDGLKVYELVNTIPNWLPARLIKLWCWLQKVWLIPYE